MQVITGNEISEISRSLKSLARGVECTGLPFITVITGV